MIDPKARSLELQIYRGKFNDFLANLSQYDIEGGDPTQVQRLGQLFDDLYHAYAANTIYPIRDRLRDGNLEEAVKLLNGKDYILHISDVDNPENYGLYESLSDLCQQMSHMFTVRGLMKEAVSYDEKAIQYDELMRRAATEGSMAQKINTVAAAWAAAGENDDDENYKRIKYELLGPHADVWLTTEQARGYPTQIKWRDQDRSRGKAGLRLFDPHTDPRGVMTDEFRERYSQFQDMAEHVFDENPNSPIAQRISRIQKLMDKWVQGKATAEDCDALRFLWIWADRKITSEGIEKQPSQSANSNIVAPFVQGDYRPQYVDLGRPLDPPPFDKRKGVQTQPLPPLSDIPAAPEETLGIASRAGKAIKNWLGQAWRDLNTPRQLSEEEKAADISLDANFERLKDSFRGMTAGDFLYGVGGTLNDLTDRVGGGIKGRVEDFKDPGKAAQRRQDEVHARNAQAAARQQEEIVAGIRNSDGESYDPNTEYFVGVPGINPLGFDADLRERAEHGENLSALAAEQSRRNETPEQREEREKQEFLDWQEKQKKPRKKPANPDLEIPKQSTPGRKRGYSRPEDSLRGGNEEITNDETGSLLSPDDVSGSMPEDNHAEQNEGEENGVIPPDLKDDELEDDRPQPSIEEQTEPPQGADTDRASQKSRKQRLGWFGGKQEKQYAPAEDIIMDGSEVDDEPRSPVPQKPKPVPIVRADAPSQEMMDDSYSEPSQLSNELQKTLEERMQDLRDKLGDYAYQTQEGRKLQEEMKNRAYLEEQ